MKARVKDSTSPESFEIVPVPRITGVYWAPGENPSGKAMSGLSSGRSRSRVGTQDAMGWLGLLTTNTADVGARELLGMCSFPMCSRMLSCVASLS